MNKRQRSHQWKEGFNAGVENLNGGLPSKTIAEGVRVYSDDQLNFAPAYLDGYKTAYRLWEMTEVIPQPYDIEKLGTGLMQSRLQVCVLWKQDEELNNLDQLSLEDIARMGIVGDFSIEWDVQDRLELTEEEMADALKAQGSDPSFLLGEEWEGEE